MLVRLEIRNFAVISHSVFEPGTGLNVLTGETGAGKSLLIDALGLVLGAKASRGLIRSDCEKASIEAVFDISKLQDEVKGKIRELLCDSGIGSEDDTIIMTREISSDGRSLARINGRSCVLSLMSGIASFLVDIHGQNDTQRIFDESTHTELLDRFTGEAAARALTSYKDELKIYKDMVLRIRDLGSSPEKLQKRREYLEFASGEIRKAEIREGEDEELQELKKKFSEAAKIENLLGQAEELVVADSGANDLMKRASGVFQKLAQSDPDYKEMAEKIESLSLELDSLASDIGDRINEDAFSEKRLEEIDQRISLIFDLKSRYGDDLIGFADRAEAEIYEIDQSGKVLADLKKQLKLQEKKLLDAASELSKIRHDSAPSLSRAIESELSDLEMPGARFEVSFEEHPKSKFFAITGTENIRFLMSANPGQDRRPLSRIASGGEASRIMLAIKTILSAADYTPTLIFDEIDAGISGIAALKVAEKLKRIGKTHQVLSVSHTAQIAAAADMNFFVRKETDGISTSAITERLDDNGRIREVSRLLSGTDDKASEDLAVNLIARFTKDTQ